MEKGVVTLIRHSAEAVDHAVVCLTSAGSLAQQLPFGTAIVELGKPPGNSIAFLLRLARELRKLRPCVVHTRNWPGLDGVIAARLAGLTRVVHGEHGLGSDDPTGLKPRRLMLRRVLRSWPREYICVSKSLERWLRQDVGVTRPVTSILNGVDTTLYHPGSRGEARASLCIATEAFVIGVVARLDAIKDHSTLLSAFAAVRQRLPASRLVVVGDGPERQRLELSAPADTLFLGNRADVPQIMRTFDVFVLPSVNEGISNTIIEAMASGLPVIASRVGGNTELVQDGITGSLFQAGDSAALAALLFGYAASRELRAEHGAMGRNRALEKFSIASMVASYRAVWERVGC